MSKFERRMATVAQLLVGEEDDELELPAAELELAQRYVESKVFRDLLSQFLANAPQIQVDLAALQSDHEHHDHGEDEDDAGPDPLLPDWTVRGLQERLVRLDYLRGDPTGRMDRATKEALQALQREANLPDHGEPDPATRAALAARVA